MTQARRPTESGTPSGQQLLERELAHTQRQLASLDAWHAARHVVEEAVAVRAQSREQRMDLARRLEVVRAEHAAIVRRTDEALRASVEALVRLTGPRVLLAHRNPWLLDKLTAALTESGCEVVGSVADGAEAVGAVVAEQPDLLLVEDVLPRLSGVDVIREVRAYCPHTLIAAQVGYDDAIGAVLDAGAAAAFTRQVPPADVARSLVDLLAGAPA